MIINMADCYTSPDTYETHSYYGYDAFSFSNATLNTSRKINCPAITPWSLYGYTINDVSGNRCIFGAVREASYSSAALGWGTQNLTSNSVIAKSEDFTFNDSDVQFIPYKTTDKGSCRAWIFGRY